MVIETISCLVLFICFWVQFYLTQKLRGHYKKMLKAFTEITTHHRGKSLISGFEPECSCGKNLKDCLTYGAIINWAVSENE